MSSGTKYFLYFKPEKLLNALCISANRYPTAMEEGNKTLVSKRSSYYKRLLCVIEFLII